MQSKVQTQPHLLHSTYIHASTLRLYFCLTSTTAPQRRITIICNVALHALRSVIGRQGSWGCIRWRGVDCTCSHKCTIAAALWVEPDVPAFCVAGAATYGTDLIILLFTSSYPTLCSSFYSVRNFKFAYLSSASPASTCDSSELVRVPARQLTPGKSLAPHYFTFHAIGTCNILPRKPASGRFDARP